MPTLAPPLEHAASRRAAANLSANLRALGESCPLLTGAALPTDIIWQLGRDGSLTGRRADGAFLGRCSVPLMAARELCRDMAANTSSLVLIGPRTGHAIRAALEKLRPSQVLMVSTPDPLQATEWLCVDNFAGELRAGRLWLLVGEPDAALEHLHAAEPSLLLPSQFTRLADAPADAATVSTRLHDKVVSLSASVSRAIATAVEDQSPSPQRPTRLCLIAPSRFALWNFAPSVLRRELDEGDTFSLKLHDCDDPRSAAPLALARFAAECDALVAADLGRDDVPGVVRDDLAWVCWASGSRVPRCVNQASRDVLLIADPSLRRIAKEQGWPGDRVHVAGWPAVCEPIARSGSGAPRLTMLADVEPLAPPKELKSMSSFAVLWEQIAAELVNDPSRLTRRPVAHVRAVATSVGIDPNSLPMALFAGRLVPTAFAIGVATALRRAGVRLVLAGSGWDAMEELAGAWAGPIGSLREWRDHVAAASCLVHVAVEAPDAHPVFTVGRPVLRTHGRTTAAMIDDAKRLLAGQLPPAVSRGNLLSAELVQRVLAG